MCLKIVFVNLFVQIHKNKLNNQNSEIRMLMGTWNRISNHLPNIWRKRLLKSKTSVIQRQNKFSIFSLSKCFPFLAEHPLKRRASRRARAGSVRRTGSRNRRQGSVRSGSRTPSVAGGGGPDRSSSASRRPNGQLGRERRARQTSETQKSSDVESGEVSDTTKTKPTQKTDYFYTLLQTGKKPLKE